MLTINLNEDGSIKQVDEAWDLIEPEQLVPRNQFPLIAQLKSGHLLIVSGDAYIEGFVLNVKHKSIIHTFTQSDMHLQSVCSGQYTPDGTLIAFCKVKKAHMLLSFDEQKNRFEQMFGLVNVKSEQQIKTEEKW